MERHSFDPTVFDYTWKQNRLAKDKEALKNSLMNIIHKKPKKPGQPKKPTKPNKPKHPKKPTNP